jgi:site-specific recombinase
MSIYAGSAHMPLLLKKSELVDALVEAKTAGAPSDSALGAELQRQLERRTTLFVEAASFEERRHRLEGLVRYIWNARTERSFSLKLTRWLQLLAQDGGMRERFQTSFDRMIGEMHSVTLFASAGVPSHHHGLVSESMRRIVQRVLPSVHPQSDLAGLFATLFPSSRDVERLLSLTPAAFNAIAELTSPASAQGTESHGLENIARSDMKEAMCLLSTRIASRGLTAAMRQRGSGLPVDHSPFYRFVFETEAFVNAGSTENLQKAFVLWSAVVRRCREEIEQVHLHMEKTGVSADLMFDLKSIEGSLDRMNAMANVYAADTRGASVAAARKLFDQLAIGQLSDMRLRPLLSQNLNLLAREMERTGVGGEHYIAHSRSDYWLMWRAALGGGLLTVFTAALKMSIIGKHFPLFVEGFLTGTNYAVSFVLLQVFGLALATKQPSMTAATFAGIVRRNRGTARWVKIAEFVADITRSQLAAALGNIIAVVVGAVAFEKVWQRMFSKSYLPLKSAQHVYQTLHPFTSGTAFFAIITGVILWMAAMIGGWCENFSVYHRVTEAVAEHPFGLRIGRRRLRRWADILERDLAGWTTSISLGYLLGFTPVIASFFGFHIDVRHVTLTTGTLALAAARFGTSSFGRDWFYWAVGGIGITFVLNLGVSFSIAAYVALRAYDVPRKEQRELVGFILLSFLKSPLKFILPIGVDAEKPSPAVEELLERKPETTSVHP